MRRFILVMLALSVVGGVALACPPAAVVYPAVYRQRTGYTQYYVAPVEKVYYPSYRISYDSEAARLLEAVEKLTLAVEGMQAGNGQQPSGQQVVANRCASCHAAKVADERGNGYTLLTEDGAQVKLSRNDAKRILGRLTTADPTKRMPPGKPLALLELRALQSLVQNTD